MAKLVGIGDIAFARAISPRTSARMSENGRLT